jgi:hypothetical protein
MNIRVVGEKIENILPPKQEPLKWLDMTAWDQASVPERQWAIRDRVPLRQAGLFSGEGGTHALTMRSFGNLNRSDSIQQQDSNALAVARLTKAFASQVDALAKLRRGGEQRVVVEHVHVYPGGQAIVGTLNHTGAPGVLENQRQPHARNQEQTSTPTASETLRSEDPERETVPVSCGEGPQALPNARRSPRIRGPIRGA